MGRLAKLVTVFGIVLFINLSYAALAQERFTDNGDGTVTDHKLGLMWGQADNQGDINWHQAKKWAKYTFPYTISKMYDNWRLPTIKELESLYLENSKGYETECGISVKIIPQIKLSCAWVWAAGTRSITANIFNFNRGYQHTDRMVKNRGYRVLAVRSLK